MTPQERQHEVSILEQVMSTRAIAEELGLQLVDVRKMIYANELIALKSGGLWLVSRKSFEQHPLRAKLRPRSTPQDAR